MNIYLIFVVLCSLTNDIVPKKLLLGGKSIISMASHENPNFLRNLKNLETKPFIRFRNTQVGVDKCLDDTGDHRVGNGYTLWQCGKTNINQWFRFRVPFLGNSGYLNIVGYNSGNCISGQNWNGRLVQKNCGDGNEDHLLWKYEKQGNGYIITNKRYGNVMHNRGRKSNNGNPIFAWVKTNGDLRAQIWAIEEAQTQEERNKQLEKEPTKCLVRLYDNDDTQTQGINDKDYSCTILPHEKDCNAGSIPSGSASGSGSGSGSSSGTRPSGSSSGSTEDDETSPSGKNGKVTFFEKKEWTDIKDDLTNDVKKIQNLSTKCACTVYTNVDPITQRMGSFQHRLYPFRSKVFPTDPYEIYCFSL